MGESKPLIRWLSEPEDRHVRAAHDYLTLLAGAADIDRLAT